MNILITGSAGFIGFHLQKKLEEHHNVIGLDNYNSYYDLNLKKNRVKLLKNKPIQLDLNNFNELNKFLKKNKFDVVIHLAAQAGVRYSFEDPLSYINSNIYGTYNILELLKSNPPKHFIFASTSSVYGLRKKNSFKESDETSMPLSLYSATKKSCEVLIYNYSKNFNIPSTILRFFTVYGPWGRPDMSLYKFVKNIKNEIPIDVFNNGQMWRDFTYIDDLVKSIEGLLKVYPNESNRTKKDSLSYEAPYRIINIGNQKTIKLSSFIKTIEDIIGKKAIKNYLPMPNGDVPYTLSNTDLLYDLINYRPNTSILVGVKNFWSWYREYSYDKGV